MKKSIKSKILVISLLFVIILSIGSVWAANDVCKFNVSSNKTKATKGDTITLNLGLDDVTGVTGGIFRFVAQMEYNQDMFEIGYIEDEEIEEEIDLESLREEFGVESLKIAFYDDEGWCLLIGDIEGANGAIIIGETSGDPVESSEDIGTIKLKVIDDEASTEEIIFSEISVIDSSRKDYEISAKSKASIKISNSTTDEGTSGSQSESGNNKNNAKNNANNNNNANKNINPNTPANEAAPYAGTKEVAPIIFAVALIATIGFAGVIKYKGIE